MQKHKAILLLKDTVNQSIKIKLIHQHCNTVYNQTYFFTQKSSLSDNQSSYNHQLLPATFLLELIIDKCINCQLSLKFKPV